MSSKNGQVHVAIIDHGMGNLFSVAHAVSEVGAVAKITHSPEEVLSADGVILPGVGSFENAMNRLKELELVDTLRKVRQSSKPLMGICLGMQLLLEESLEFGSHQGLGFFPGKVVPFDTKAVTGKRCLKVPHVGWNRATPFHPGGIQSYDQTPLKGMQDGEFMYFVHSFYVKLADESIALTRTQYGDISFCSSLLKDNIFACQFHPERSGAAGLEIYKNFWNMCKRNT